MEALTKSKWYAKPNRTENLFVLFGILVTVMWLILFVAGLHINSSYYRTAIMYGYADVTDWIFAILTFTLSNVAVLAFLSGLLGGIISKVRITEGFVKTTDELKSENLSPILYENPFISAFRGVFIFIAVLSIQYFSSFSDFNSIANQEPVQQSKEAVRDQQVYTELLLKVNDSASRAAIQQVWQGQQVKQKESNMDSLVTGIRLYKDSIAVWKAAGKDIMKIDYWESQVKNLRNMVKPPPGTDLAGLSSSSYFKFSIIVSLLSFICGYDPARFSQFLSNFPLFKKEAKDKGQPQDA